MEENNMFLESNFIRFVISKETGRWEVIDKSTGVVWGSNPYSARFGEVIIVRNNKKQSLPLTPDAAWYEGEDRDIIYLSFHIDNNIAIMVTLSLQSEGKCIEVSYASTNSDLIEEIRLFDNGFGMTNVHKGYILVPGIGLGMLVLSDSGKEFTEQVPRPRMEMLGFVKKESAAMLTWHDPYALIELHSTVSDNPRKQTLCASLPLSKTAKSFHLYFLGKGEISDITKLYRSIAKKKGFVRTWEQKAVDRPQVRKLFGAANFKFWGTLQRIIGNDLQEKSSKVSWTFDEVTQIAEHLKNDLKLDRVLFIIGGWIHRGYDNQHPDILPAAPECGGDEALRNCSKRIQELGYLFCLHDIYQDIYRDSPSWDEKWIMKHPDGTIVRGGQWNGGQAYLTCSKKAVELAKRAQNLPAVKKRYSPNSYFIDTTYAAPLYECYDPSHPLTKWDDIYWKCVISDYARGLFGIFGSEDGYGWAVPHGDFFEGLVGVYGKCYNWIEPKKFGAIVMPLFEMVYHDCVAIYGKYNYKFEESAEYVLYHISIARTLNYHSIGEHLYWKTESTSELPFPSGADRACFTRAHNGWAEGMCLTDRYIKNTYEILSALNELTSEKLLTKVKLLTKDGKVRSTYFGEDTRTVVNATDRDYVVQSRIGGEVVLPPFGFLIELPTFIAFHSKSWKDMQYKKPVLFTLRSQDGKPLMESAQVRIFHAFGDARINWKNKTIEVDKEVTL